MRGKPCGFYVYGCDDIHYSRESFCFWLASAIVLLAAITSSWRQLQKDAILWLWPIREPMPESRTFFQISRCSTKRESRPREVLGTSQGLLFQPNPPKNTALLAFSPDFFSATKRTRNPPENARFSQVLGPLFSRPRTLILGLKSALVPCKYASYVDFALEKSEKSIERSKVQCEL